MTLMRTERLPLAEVHARAFTIPTDHPESDGTLEWDSTTLVLATVAAGDATGIGWTYGHQAVATIIESTLAQTLNGHDALDVEEAWAAMVAALRNNGRPGLSSMAIAAVDVALWDLKAKLLSLPLVALLGRFHAAVPVYGSGGFTSYTNDQLQSQLGGWARSGLRMVKMKVGRDPGRDPDRLRAVREAIGSATQLFVDGNGAYRPAEAVAVAEGFSEQDVRWFEEPVSSDDLAGLRFVRDRAPVGMDIAAGEYGYDLPYFERMLASGAVDVLQADVTRCAGITDLRRVDALCRARSAPLSLHCSPTIHANVGPALETLVHLEYFHDHVRIEEMLFDGVPRPVEGALAPNTQAPGLGIEFRARDAERYAV
jgi:L-alanine-DL-glutamate epimerase-like enolase superfamily enzyme